MTGERTSPIQPGDRFLDLEVLERVGQGAFATVFRARDTLLERDVALKVFDPSRIPDPESGRRGVLREARMVAQLRSPCVVTLHRVHELPGGHWVCELEYVDGGDLRARIEPDRALPPDEAERIARSVLTGLAEAHALGIVHGDVKPPNVLLGSAGAVKLTDFGLGLFTQEVSLSSGEAPGRRGTPHYMAPEVVMEGALSSTSDVWSVGVLLYRMLTGRLPFPQDQWDPLFLAIQNDAPPSLPATVPARLAELTMGCLAKRVGDRAPHAGVALEQLEGTARAVPASGALTAPLAAGPAKSRLIGREEPLGTMRTHLEALRGGVGRCVLVMGEAGIGKTALLQGLVREAGARGFQRLETRLSSLEGLRRPLLHLLRTSFDAAVEVDGRERPGSSSSASRAERLAQLQRAEAAVPERGAAHASAAIERALVDLAVDRPLVLVIDDVHLGDREDLRLLGSLVTVLADHPALVALAWRTRDPRGSDSSDGWTTGYRDLLALPGVFRLDLEALSDGAMRELLEQVSGTRALPPALVERVIQASEGIPLYALALFRHLEDAGEIARTESGIRFTPRWDSGEPPPLLRDMVAHRLQGLSAEQRRLLETAAVSGGSFTGHALAQLVDQPILEVLRELQRLYRDRDLVVPLEHGFRFVHQLYREVIASGLSPDLRRALHQAWAELLESGPDEADPEVLGWHWEQAGDGARAASPLREAAWRAADRGEQTRAWDLADRSGVLDHDVSPAELRANLDLLLSLQPAFDSAEEADRVERLYRKLDEAARALDDAWMRRRVTVKTGWSTFFRHGGAAVDAAALQDAADELPDGVARAEAWWLLGLLARNRGALAAAREPLERAAAIFSTMGRSDDSASILGVLGSLPLREGKLDEAYDLLRRATAAHEMTGRGVHWAISKTLATVVAAQAGRGEGTAAALDEPIRTLERGGQGARAAQARIYQAQLLQSEGRTGEARATLDRAEQVLREGAMGGALLPLLFARAHQDIMAGELARAHATLAEAEERAGPGEPGQRATLAVRRALLHAVEGSRVAAAEQARHGLDVLAAIPDRPGHARLVQELVPLALFDVELLSIEPSLSSLVPPEAEAPSILAAPARVLRTALRSADLAADGDACTRIASICAALPFGWHVAEMSVVGRLFAAYGHLAAEDLDRARADLDAARGSARELGYVWYELLALRAAHDAGLPVEAQTAADLVTEIQEQNAEQPDLAARALERALGSWAVVLLRSG